jgi:exosortase/archaeosortase family protein
MKAAKKFWKGLKKDVKSRKGLLGAGQFVAIFLLSFAVFLYLIIPLAGPFWEGMGLWHANAVSGLLSSWGIETTVSGNVLTMQVIGENVDFAVSEVCSGAVEIALLVSLLIASFDIALGWRIVGSLAGALLLLLMNPIRIAVTMALTKDAGMEAGDFYHGMLFRLFLFVILVLYYFVWYRLAKDRKCDWRGLCKRLS